MILVLASTNSHKAEEIKEMLALEGVQLVSLDQVGDFPPVIEDGTTFLENAIKKAMAIANDVSHWVLADDSGLEVDFLQGAPGVHSARFAGEPRSDERNNQRLLKELLGVKLPLRTARFCCALALVSPAKEIHTFLGVCEGLIVEEPRGSFGFGYDPLFFLPAYGKTLAELGPTVKNTLSHRALAVLSLKDFLQKRY